MKKKKKFWSRKRKESWVSKFGSNKGVLKGLGLASLLGVIGFSTLKLAPYIRVIREKNNEPNLEVHPEV